MRSAGAVGVPCLDDESPTEEGPFDIDADVGGPPRQTVRNEHLNAIERQPFVATEILTPCVGVDRHLGELASTDGSNDVDRHGPTPSAGQLDRIGRDMHLHGRSIADRHTYRIGAEMPEVARPEGSCPSRDVGDARGSGTLRFPLKTCRRTGARRFATFVSRGARFGG